MDVDVAPTCVCGERAPPRGGSGNHMSEDAFLGPLSAATVSTTSAGLRVTSDLCVPADVDDCAGQPCENGGACRDLDGAFKCHCPSPYVGKHCQQRK